MNVSIASTIRQKNEITTILVGSELNIRGYFYGFYLGFTKVKGKDTIVVVVDRLSKYGNFISRSHPYTEATVTETFIDSMDYLAVY